jgi:hypothetical protein
MMANTVLHVAILYTPYSGRALPRCFPTGALHTIDVSSCQPLGSRPTMSSSPWAHVP